MQPKSARYLARFHIIYLINSIKYYKDRDLSITVSHNNLSL